MEALLYTALISGGIFFVAYNIGRNSSKQEKSMEDIIEFTIEALCRDGYLYYSYDDDGMLTIETIDDYNIRRWNEENGPTHKEEKDT